MSKSCDHAKAEAAAMKDAKLIMRLAEAARTGERRRIRRAIAPALRYLRNKGTEEMAVVADNIDRATKPAARKGAKGRR